MEDDHQDTASQSAGPLSQTPAHDLRSRIRPVAADHYRRCGRSGIDLPEVSLGLWHNFGNDRSLDTQRAIFRRAFDLGLTHFCLANKLQTSLVVLS